MTYTENDIRKEVLTALSNAKGGSRTTTELIDDLTSSMKPSGKDAEILDGRSDTHFSQKVRNVVSHRNQGTGLVARGLVTYDEANERLTITSAGQKSVN